MIPPGLITPFLPPSARQFFCARLQRNTNPSPSLGAGLSERPCRSLPEVFNAFIPKTNWPLTASFAITVFLHKLWSSAIKGQFCPPLVSSIILYTSLSVVLTGLFLCFRFSSSHLTQRHALWLWPIMKELLRSGASSQDGLSTFSLVLPFLFSDYIIVHLVSFFKPAYYTNFILSILCKA